MATVAPEVRGAQPAPTPPVRHGTCRLTVIIDGTEYRLTKVALGPRRMAPQATWRNPARAPSIASLHTKMS